jgi:hypothetical protein
LQIAPVPRLPRECQYVDSGWKLADSSNQRVEIRTRGGGREIPLPERHVESRVLAAHEPCDTNATFHAHYEREQQEWLSLSVGGDDNAGQKLFVGSDVPLPGRQEVESLIGRRKLRRLEITPDRLGFA